MKQLNIMNKAARVANTAVFHLKKNSPVILVGAGIVGMGFTIFSACKATLKVNDVIDEAKENIDKIHEAVENGITQAGETYSVEDSKKDLTIAYVQTGVKFAKLYGPTILMGVLSTTSILAGYNILRKRYVASTAAYAVLDKSFKEYRGRVVERFGENLDHELKYNIKAAEIEETVIDGKGKEKTVKKNIDVIDPNALSAYEFVFDRTNPYWERNKEYNLMFINARMNYLTDKLRATKECIFMNDALDELAFSRTQEGQLMGWRFDKNREWRDNCLNYIVKEVYRPSTERDGEYEPVLLIELIVDGNVWKTM